MNTRPKGQTIQIYLPSGEDGGIRISEITTRLVQVIWIPRLRLAVASQRPELERVSWLSSPRMEDLTPMPHENDRPRCRFPSVSTGLPWEHANAELSQGIATSGSPVLPEMKR